jgi:hypothetical protein
MGKEERKDNKERRNKLKNQWKKIKRQNKLYTNAVTYFSI